MDNKHRFEIHTLRLDTDTGQYNLEDFKNN